MLAIKAWPIVISLASVISRVCLQLLHITYSIEQITSASRQQLVPIVLGHGQPPLALTSTLSYDLIELFNQGPLLGVCMLYVHYMCT